MTAAAARLPKKQCCCSDAAAPRVVPLSHNHASVSSNAGGESAGHQHHPGTHGEAMSPASAANENQAVTRDPVCGMTVDPHTTPHRHSYAGRTYYFCSAGCLAKFSADPQKYIGQAQPKAPVPDGTIYTCPMHPQIRQVGPGSCPICGMALEPVIASAEAQPNAELIDMTRRFWIGLVLA